MDVRLRQIVSHPPGTLTHHWRNAQGEFFEAVFKSDGWLGYRLGERDQYAVMHADLETLKSHKRFQ